ERSAHARGERRGGLVRPDRAGPDAHAGDEVVGAAERIGDDAVVVEGQGGGRGAGQLADQDAPGEWRARVELGEPAQRVRVVLGGETELVGVGGEHEFLLGRIAGAYPACAFCRWVYGESI